MKFTVILLLVAACHAEELRNPRGRQKSGDQVNTDKRALEEGSNNVSKRTPALSTVAPSVTPGIEYADTKESQQEQSPTQQAYETPVPRIVKISDLLSGQAPQFQAAIANHLYSPVSVYQARLPGPAYEVSAPIPSQLAYSEHKIAYQPQQNAIHYTPQTLKQVNFARLPNYQPTYSQQILVQPQSVYPQQIPHPQQIVQQIPQFAYQPQVLPQQVLGAVQYIQNPQGPPVTYLRNQIPVPFTHAPQQLIPIPVRQLQQLQQIQPGQQLQLAQQIHPGQQIQPGVTYAQPTNNVQQNLQHVQKNQQVVQIAQQTAQPARLLQPVVVKDQEPQQKPNIQQQTAAYTQPQGAVSYASFSQSQPSNGQQKTQQYQYSPQLQYQNQPSTPQIQFQPLHTQVHVDSKENLVASQSNAASGKPSYFRPGPTAASLQQPLLPPVFPQGHLIIPNPGYAPHTVPIPPTFPPIQYFGKFAQSIFGRQY